MADRLVARIARVLLFTAFVFGAEVASAGPIVLAWDPNPDTQVAGYRVYVGTEPGTYTEAFDVGATTTSFNYGPKETRVYYFTVASYATGPLVGQRSVEVSSFGSPTATATPDPNSAATAPDSIVSTAPPDPASYWRSLWASAASALGAHAPATRQPASTECPDARSECESVRTLVTVPTPITSLAATDDGRLFFIESGRRVQLMTSDTLVAYTVLGADNKSVVFTDVVVDPTFAATGLLYLGEIETKSNGRREFRVVRYRVRGNVAGERLTIVHGIPLSASGEAHLTMDAERHLHIAAPSAAVSGATSLVLRLNADGTVPPDNPRGSPVVSEHAGELAAIALVGDRLWLFDQRGGTAESNGGQGLASAFARSLGESGRAQSAANIVSFASSELAGGSRELLALLSDGTLSRTPINEHGMAGLTTRTVMGRAGALGDLATDAQGVAYVTVTSRSLRGVTSSILRVSPAR